MEEFKVTLKEVLEIYNGATPPAWTELNAEKQKIWKEVLEAFQRMKFVLFSEMVEFEEGYKTVINRDSGDEQKANIQECYRFYEEQFGVNDPANMDILKFRDEHM